MSLMRYECPSPKVILLDFDLRRIAALIAILSFGIDPLPEGKAAN